ncbi:MAG: hypothetical protein RIC87_08480 [Kiloniellales bacterium]
MMTLSFERPLQRPQSAVSCYCVEGASDPGLLPRVLELFAKRGLVPERFHAQPSGHSAEALVIDLQVRGFNAAEREVVASCLRQIPLVWTVLTSEKVTV